MSVKGFQICRNREVMSPNKWSNCWKKPNMPKFIERFTTYYFYYVKYVWGMYILMAEWFFFFVQFIITKLTSDWQLSTTVDISITVNHYACLYTCRTYKTVPSDCVWPMHDPAVAYLHLVQKKLSSMCQNS